MNSKVVLACAIGFATLQLTGCGGGSGSGTVISPVQVASFQTGGTVGDSTESPYNIIEGGTSTGGQFASLTLDRDSTVTMNYMVNEPILGVGETPKGLIVLLSGGYMHTRLGSDPVSTVFFSRSAHLFANNGFRVVTIEHPSDHPNYYPAPWNPINPVPYDPQDSTTWDPTDDNNFAWYDDYRASPDHRNDLEQLINHLNLADLLDVVLVGYGRGVISAAANADLVTSSWSVEAIVMVSPATYGNRALLSSTPILTTNTFSIPVFMTYHVQDDCLVREYINANSDTIQESVADSVADLRETLIRKGNTFDMVAIDGGFTDPASTEACGPLTFHGFLGVEASTVNYISTWIEGILP